jgi:putative ABC transport system ATP-binding protein
MIEIRDLAKTYQTGESPVHALRGVSLSIGPGEFTAIAGPSGSGKTTLLNLVGCIDHPDSGGISIDGADVLALDARRLSAFRREKLGFVFQTFNLIPVLTAFENVALALHILGVPADEAAERTMKILDEVGLKGMEGRLPTKLSGGQQQRVAIARALVKRPLVVLADEPTANLDSATGQSILELMGELNRGHGTTFLFSTHDPMVMGAARRLVRLHDGLVTSDESKAAAGAAR